MKGPLQRWLEDDTRDSEPVKWERPYHEVEVLRDYAYMKDMIDFYQNRSHTAPSAEIKAKNDQFKRDLKKFRDKGVINEKIYAGAESRLNAIDNATDREPGVPNRVEKIGDALSTYMLNKVEPEIAKWFLKRGVLAKETDVAPDRYDELADSNWGRR